LVKRAECHKKKTWGRSLKKNRVQQHLKQTSKEGIGHQKGIKNAVKRGNRTSWR